MKKACKIKTINKVNSRRTGNLSINKINKVIKANPYKNMKTLLAQG